MLIVAERDVPIRQKGRTMPENAQSPPQPVLKIPTFVSNHDVVGILDRLGRFAIELIRSDSSNLSTMTVADKARLTSYLDAVDQYVTYVAASPVLDLPKTSHAVPWPVEPLDPVPAINNEDVEDLVRLFMIAHTEIANSDSAGSGSGLTTFDAARLTAVILKARNFLNVFINKSSPLDLPASSPMDPITPIAR
jgi:hypothetical protein